MKLNQIAVGLSTLALGLSLAACGSDPTDTSSTGGSSAAKGPIVVGSASFGESKILAEIYAGALNAQGIEATTKLDIGQREAYIAAIEEGSIHLFPEYTGNLLAYFDSKATATSPEDVEDALDDALPEGLEILDAAPGEDKDSLNVTADFAAQHQLTSIADLASISDLKLAGNPEFKSRPYGVPGLESVYGIKGIQFTAISDGGGPATLKALVDGDVDVANIYSTTPSIAENNLVTLSDPENLIAAQNIVPLIREEVETEKIEDILDAVSAKITTQALIELNAAFAGDAKPTPAAVAADWLKANGFA